MRLCAAGAPTPRGCSSDSFICSGCGDPHFIHRFYPTGHEPPPSHHPQRWPHGLETAAAIMQAGLEVLVLTRARLSHDLEPVPPATRFFITRPHRHRRMLDHQCRQEKTTREEYLAYLRSVVDTLGIDVRTHEVHSSTVCRIVSHLRFQPGQVDRSNWPAVRSPSPPRHGSCAEAGHSALPTSAMIS